VPTLAADNFRVDPAAVMERINEKTRAVLLNSPSNPSGALIGEEDLEAIVAGCAERGVLVIADETYERFVYDGVRFPSAAALASRYPETVVLVGSFSKTYAMTGWRIGYLLGPAEITRAVTAIQSHATSNPTSFAMQGALAALEHAEPDVETMIAEYGARRELVMDELSRIPGVSCLPPQGAFYAFPQVKALYREGLADSVEFAEHLLEKARVAVVPGAAFGADEHVRISFACSREDLTEGLGRIRSAVEEFATVT
jgi:aspartate aminotransferase